ncbi:MAG: YraN family protein [Deltaproteobacteria bacterium]|nr:YraN family protein [Deltaproteobacteria bacterium]
MSAGAVLKGSLGEDAAVKELKRLGYRILERNYRCRTGEIDIIALDKDTVVFVEVKTRGSDSFGDGKSSVDVRKQRKIVSASMQYLSSKALSGAEARFDVVDISMKDGRLDIEVIRDAFLAGS